MKKIVLIIIAYTIMFPFVVNAEEVRMEWINSIGGSENERFESLIVTDKDEYIAVGSTDSKNITGMVSSTGGAIISKYDSDGNIVWERLFDELNGSVFTKVIAVDNDEYVAVGRYRAAQYNNDILIVKYDSDGNIVWRQKWGGNESDYANEIIQTKDKELIIIGATSSTNVSGITLSGGQDALILKYDKDGNLIWQKNIGGPGAYYGTFESFENIIEQEDGTMLVCGSLGIMDGETNYGQNDAVIIKFDKDGNILSRITWGGSNDDEFERIHKLPNGEYLVEAGSRSLDLNIEGINVRSGLKISMLIKFNEKFEMQWAQQWDTADGNIKSLKILKDGSILVSGISYAIDDMAGESMVKVYGSNGELKASKIVQQDGIRVAGIVAHDNKYYMIGNSMNKEIEGINSNGGTDFMLIKYNDDLTPVWKYNYGGTEYEYLDKAILTKDNKIVAIGMSYSDIGTLQNKGKADAIVTKYSIEYDMETVQIENDKGTIEVEQNGAQGIITALSNEGFQVDQIIVKDKKGNVLDVEITKLEDGIYSFPLYTDVSVEVTYKEKIDNPKTGIIDVIMIIFIGLVMSLCGFVLVKNYNERLEI